MSAGLDAMQRYLDALPEGLDSHPECRMKGSAFRSFLEGLPSFSPPRELPEALVALLERPPLPGAWAPEVPVHALMLFAVHELFGGEAGWLAHAYRTNRALLDSLTYRVLFRLVGPRTALSQASARWGMFHTGSSLEPMGRISRQGGTLHLRTPPGHCPEIIAGGYAEGFRAAIEVAGGRDPQIDVRSQSPELLVFALRWT